MDILSLKRQLWAVHGFRVEGGPGDTAGSGDSLGGGDGIGLGGSDGYGEYGANDAQSQFRQQELAYQNLITQTMAEKDPGLYAQVQKVAKVSGLAKALAWGMEQRPDEYGAYMQAAGLSAGSGLNSDGGHGSETGPLAKGGSADGDTAVDTKDPWDDLFATFTGGGTDVAYTAPTYNADPTGMIARASTGADRFQRNFDDTYGRMGSEVARYNDSGYQAQQRGIAVADAQQQVDSQMGQARRNLERSGVNPASGRMLAMENQNAINAAGLKVQAAMNSDKSLRDTYIKGLSGLQTANSDYAKTAQGWGTFGADAAKAQNAWSLGSSELGLKAQTQNQTNKYQWGSLANQRYGIDKGVSNNAANNQASADRQRDSDTTTLLGIGLKALF